MSCTDLEDKLVRRWRVALDHAQDTVARRLRLGRRDGQRLAPGGQFRSVVQRRDPYAPLGRRDGRRLDISSAAPGWQLRFVVERRDPYAPHCHHTVMPSVTSPSSPFISVDLPTFGIPTSVTKPLR